MFKRLFLCLAFSASALNAQPVPPTDGFIEAQHRSFLQKWSMSNAAKNLHKEFSLELHDPLFAAFLNEFASHKTVKKALKNRPYIDFTHRIAKDVPNYKELIEIMISEDERKEIKMWFEGFAKILETFNAHILPNTAHAEPGTIVFSFDKHPGYVVKCLAWNYYPLGCYDAQGNYSCLVPGCTISQHPFSLQLVSRILYAQEIKRCTKKHKIKNVRVPQKFLYLRPGTHKEPLRDENVFVVAEKINFNGNEQQELIKQHLLMPTTKITKEMLQQKAAHKNDHSLLANMARIILDVGLYDFSPQTQNFVMCKDPKNPAEAHVIFTDVERPPFGGSNPLYFFHTNKEEVATNARVGLEGLVALLNEFDIKTNESESTKDITEPLT